MRLPDTLPTGAVLKALSHVADHHHDGVTWNAHFAIALVEELGIAAPERERA